MASRYSVSKLLNLFFVRELASRLPRDSPLVIIAADPGFCVSSLRRNPRDAPWYTHIFFWFMDALVAWPTERGSRQLVFAALGDQDKLDEMRGAYTAYSKVAEPSDYVISDEGAKVQNKLWVRPLRFECNPST